MIKLKLTREQLFVVCGFVNPADLEQKVNHEISWNKFHDLDRLFTLIQIGESLSKKYLFTCKNTYKISLKNAEAAALLSHTCKLEQSLDPLSYEYNVMQVIRQGLHQQVINFQRKYYGRSNGENLAIGGHQNAGGALTNAARYIG